MRIDVICLVEIEAEEQLEIIPRVGVVEELVHRTQQPALAGVTNVQCESVEAGGYRLVDILLRMICVGVDPSYLKQTSY